MDNFNASSGSSNSERKGNALVVVLFIIIGILAGLAGYLFFKQNDVKERIIVVEKEKGDIKKNADLFSKKLEELTIRYDSLILAHQGLKEELEAERNKVVVLMADYQALKRQGIQAVNQSNDDYGLMAKFKELERDFKMSKEVILDLKAKNQDLTAENFNKSKQVEEANIQTEQFKKENNKLNKIVEIAKRLKTFNLFAMGQKASTKKEKSTEKAGKVNRITTCFTILDNQLSDKQEKLIYIVIKDPNNRIFSDGDNRLALNDGSELQFSVKKNIFYDNKLMNLCLPYNIKQSEELGPGKYSVQVYCDGVSIGETSFNLK